MLYPQETHSIIIICHSIFAIDYMRGIFGDLGYNKVFLLENRRKMPYIHSPVCLDDLKTLCDMCGNFLNGLEALFSHFAQNLTKNMVKTVILEGII